MVEAVLTIEPLNHSFVNRLDYNDRAVEIGLSIHVPNNPVNKSAQEITLAKLDNLLRCSALWGSLLVE